MAAMYLAFQLRHHLDFAAINPVTGPGRAASPDREHHQQVAATTWEERYRTWWEDAARSSAPVKTRNVADWADLKQALEKASLNTAENVPLARLA